jgi:hypothetical protein
MLAWEESVNMNVIDIEYEGANGRKRLRTGPNNELL